jgi:lipoprotein-anchoring transpeptidase ErfK/SrfK
MSFSKTSSPISRRAFALGLPLAAAGCIDRPMPAVLVMRPPQRVAMLPPPRQSIQPSYEAVSDGGFEVPAVDLSEVDPQYLRRVVPHDGVEPPGTIVVDVEARHLYFVESGGRAIRYGVGVGREGLEWSGRAVVGRKAEWPRWIPTKDMIAREPQKYKRWEKGMDGGLENPIGARALYLYQNNRDTYYRIHGTNEPWSIGTSVSSGCIRMINQDVMHLYDRVAVGAPVLVG